jgi:hypothetical protein
METTGPTRGPGVDLNHRCCRMEPTVETLEEIYHPRATGNLEKVPQLAAPSTPTEAWQPVSSDPSAPPTPTIPTMISSPNLPNGVQTSLVATGFLDAPDREALTLMLTQMQAIPRSRRAHLLPGIVFDVGQSISG